MDTHTHAQHYDHQQHQHQQWKQTTLGHRICRVAALVTVVALASAGALVGARATPSVHAASRTAQPARIRLAAAATETAKVTLPETSIAGPGFDGNIAWTGTDAAHHLNARFGTGGLAFPTKFTFPETSPFGPDIIETVDHGTEPSAVLAWTGTDANHSLNVQLVPGGQKLTLHESSLGTPAMEFISSPNSSPNTVLLAWTGIDANHSLNVLPVGVLNGMMLGTKTVLRQFSSDAGPTLSVTDTGLVLGWSVRGTQQLNLATSTDNVHFTTALGSGLPQTSASAPQFRTTGSSSGCIAWTGTDAAHHLNVQCTTSFPQFPNPAQTKSVLPETALGAPGLITSQNSAEIAWTGTDAAHHLNVAQLSLP